MDLDVSQIHTPVPVGATMPLQNVTIDGKKAWRYGETGKPYTYDDAESEKEAKQKAIEQGLAMTDGKLEKGIDGPNDVEIVHSRLIDEAHGAESYNRAVDQVADPALKKLLTDIAEDELGHVAKLTAWLEANVEKSAPKTLTVEIAKVADNVVYGIVLRAGVEDLQGDIMSPEDIAKACHDYMADYRAINVDHDRDVDAFPVECWIAKEAGQLGTREYGPGDWLMGTRINDPVILQGVKDGIYKSYSIEGEGVREPI